MAARSSTRPRAGQTWVNRRTARRVEVVAVTGLLLQLRHLSTGKVTATQYGIFRESYQPVDETEL